MLRLISSIVIFSLTLFIFIQHLGTVAPIKITEEEKKGPLAKEIKKTETSHRHIILKGPSYHRGQQFALLTTKQLEEQEDLLLNSLNRFIPSKLIQKTLFSMAMLWFNGLDEKVDLETKKEIQGVASAAPTKYDHLATKLTRQYAYHALHEVGQMFVDHNRSDMGCYIVGLKKKSWLIGRNFDFDIDYYFDENKILKWVFPNQGIPYLSIIWAGMVGAVTGVNQQGVFASLNAAGSDHWARIGTPTSIILKQILENAVSAKDAIKILESTSSFITEIFIIADSKNNSVYKVEKSPEQTIVIPMKNNFVLANHLMSPTFTQDQTNNTRIKSLTTAYRQKRGEQLLASLSDINHQEVVKILRDKKFIQQTNSTQIPHPGAIDSMIASQSLVYDMKENIIHISLGPGTQGKFIAYDLNQSFQKQSPILSPSIIEEDPHYDEREYQLQREYLKKFINIKRALRSKKCQRVKELINEEVIDHYEYHYLKGLYFKNCENNPSQAKESFIKAQEYFPPYESIRNELEENIHDL